MGRGVVARDKTLLATPNEQGNGNGNGNRALIEALVNSKIYHEYEQAFTDLTGLPVALQPVETWQLPHHGKRNENPFCALMSQKSRACAACLQVQERLCEKAAQEPQTVSCPVGLVRHRRAGAVERPVDRLFADRPVFSQEADQGAVCADGQTGVGMGSGGGPEHIEKAYFAGRVCQPAQHESVVKLLAIFAQHLAMVSNQVFIQQENAESPVIKRAKEYICEHQAEKLSLGSVAKAVNMSTFYFCKMFKKVTGINFTDYLSRVRIEKAKNLLLNPNLRVSEIAFEVGFQSLTHFNRVFKKILGQSPTDYRAQLLAH